MPRTQDISVCLIGFENHKARPDLGDPSMRLHFWMLSGLHLLDSIFVIEQRLGKQTVSSTLMAQIVKVEEAGAETRVLIRPDPKVEAALGS